MIIHMSANPENLHHLPENQMGIRVLAAVFEIDRTLDWRFSYKAVAASSETPVLRKTIRESVPGIAEAGLSIRQNAVYEPPCLRAEQSSL
jgi:hypothetical protein